MNRRGFLKGLAAGGLIVAAPAIVREGLAMPVKAGLGESDELTKLLKEASIQPYPVPAEVFHNLDGEYPASVKYAAPSSDRFIKNFYSGEDISEIAGHRTLMPLDEGTEAIAWSARPLLYPVQPGHYFDPKDLSICRAADIAELKKRYPDPPIHPSYVAGHYWEAQEFQKKFMQQFLK